MIHPWHAGSWTSGLRKFLKLDSQITTQEEATALVQDLIPIEDHLQEDTGKEILALGQEGATAQVRALSPALSLTTAPGIVIDLVRGIALVQAQELALCQAQCPVFVQAPVLA